MSARSAHIIGDGPAGLVAALALAQRGWRVSLKAASRKRPARIDVLGGSALPVLERLGLGRNDVTGVARPCPGRWVDWGGEPYCVDHMRSLSSAWSVDRPAFDELLAGHAARSGVRFGEIDDTDPKGWTIDATGAIERDDSAGDDCDDRLIALVRTGPIDPASGPVDARLLIEACPEGWVYAVTYDGARLCLGVVTDAAELRGRRPWDFFAGMLRATNRIGQLHARLGEGFTQFGCALPCRLRPALARQRRLRVGDARSSYDPLAGRGLWEAIVGTERTVSLLAEDPDRLAADDRRVQATYAAYLEQRRHFYGTLRERFLSGFWLRRQDAALAPP